MVFIDRTGVIQHEYLGGDPFYNNQEKNLRDTIEEMLKASPVSAGSKRDASPSCLPAVRRDNRRRPAAAVFAQSCHSPYALRRSVADAL
jgi:hypothetical protein